MEGGDEAMWDKDTLLGDILADSPDLTREIHGKEESDLQGFLGSKPCGMSRFDFRSRILARGAQQNPARGTNPVYGGGFL